MASIDITKSYLDGEILLEADLDNIINDVETFLNTTGINDDNIQNAGITASSKLIDGTISTDKLATSAVTTEKIAADAIDGTLIADDSIDSEHYVDESIDTAHIADSAVTPAKRSSLGQQLSSSSGSFSTTSTSDTDVTNLSVSIPTTGRPVFVGLVSANHASTDSILRLTEGSGSPSTARVTMRFVRDSTQISRSSFGWSGNNTGFSIPEIPPSAVWTIDTPSAGTYTYKFTVASEDGETVAVTQCKLIAYEL